MTRISKTVLASISFLGFLLSPLPVYADEGIRPLYWACVKGLCEPATEPGRDGDGKLLLGYIKESAGPGMAPLYWSCAYLIHLGGCGQRRLVSQPRYDDSVLLGYIAVEPQPGTRPLYWSCKQRDSFGECTELAPDNSGGSPEESVLLGYLYTE
jgi:hypothetical protein